MKKQGSPKIKNLDVKSFRQLMSSAQKSCASMVEAIELHSQALFSVIPKEKVKKKRRRKPKKKK